MTLIRQQNVRSLIRQTEHPVSWTATDVKVFIDSGQTYLPSRFSSERLSVINYNLRPVRVKASGSPETKVPTHKTDQLFTGCFFLSQYYPKFYTFHNYRSFHGTCTHSAVPHVRRLFVITFPRINSILPQFLKTHNSQSGVTFCLISLCCCSSLFPPTFKILFTS